jgi:hypothetical protein
MSAHKAIVWDESYSDDMANALVILIQSLLYNHLLHW